MSSTPAAVPPPTQATREPSGPLSVRRAGVLLHVTSLETGDLGEAAFRFVDFLAAAGCTVWQVLPLVPKHQVNPSPYNAISAMAGDAELVSLQQLADEGLLGGADQVPASRADALDLAARRFLAQGETATFDAWCAAQPWLDDYVAFVALRESLDHEPWTAWPAPLRDRHQAAVAEALAPLAGRLDELRVQQWFFARQWAELKEHAAQHGVVLFGDLPIFVSLDSADVWANPQLWQLDEHGCPVTVSGVPPDYFAAEGQRWNNPHYDWDVMASDDFAWWRTRIAGQRELFDLVRIDHFRGFEAAWHVPAEAPTAKDGHWVKTPGSEVLAALVETAGEGTLVAEDLGVITPEVDALRREFGLPGMRVLQFAFDGEADNPHLPAHHEENGVVYTGTHDNDTTLGWWREQDDEARARVLAAAPDPSQPMPWAMVETALASVGRLAVVPAQDLLGLGTEARMNTPGTAEGNWGWRSEPGVYDEALAAHVRDLVERHDRLPDAAVSRA